MSVTVLYCEGNAKSIDIRVIRQLLPQCDIRPRGGKNANFLRSIIVDRRRNPNLACLVDRDKKNNRLITEEDVKSKFRELLPKFCSDGSRFMDYLCYFAGKDLLYMMRKSLHEWGFEDTSNKNKMHPEEIFLERIVSRIERIEKVWEWLPEWTALRQFISETNFS
ncbi:MAG: hypothetical protein J7647_05165 [Cyanobacteria bacterium SBLK]|nr:hypothetical protein [Cyanobacteria bacterium SBLK]